MIKTFTKHDDYMTPFSAWDNIKHLIPNDKVIWEPFYGDGTSGENLTKLGFNVIHQDKDFYTYDVPDSVVVSNPPFSDCKNILTKLINDSRPFILIMPVGKITTQYFRQVFNKNSEYLQIIIPRKRIHFKKLVNGKEPQNWGDQCYFDCFYYCWKIGLEKHITWLED